MLEPDGHLRPLQVKILVLGTICVGKTSLIQRYCYDHFSNQYKSTIGMDCGIKEVEWQHEFSLQLQFWDISGQERYVNLTRVFYQGAVGALIVLDLSNLDSLKRAIQWKLDVDQKLPGLPCVLVGNKCDLSSAISVDQLQEVVRTHRFIKHVNTSAKKNVNVDLSISMLLQTVMEHTPPTPRPGPSPRSRQHQYDDRPSPRFKLKTHSLRLTQQEQEEEEQENECCWLV